MHSVDLHDLYSSSNIISVIGSKRRCARHVALMGERRGAYRVFVIKTERDYL
jgi:hypothetical protein